MFLNNKVYDILKWIAQFILPGLATLYFAVSGIWGLPYTEQVVGTIVAVNVFLGALLGLSAIQYKKDQALQTKLNQAMTFPAYFETADTNPTTPLNIPENVYQILKWVTLIFLPAAATLYYALASLWGFPYGREVVGTVAALTAFLGLALGVSKYQFQKQTNASNTRLVE